MDRFQVDDDTAHDPCRILLSDESGGEGRNFQMASQIIHVDLPWTPAQVEQRIGRVDRVGRQGEVLSVVPLARNTLEEDLYGLWQKAFKLFEQSMSGLEIVLEDVQDQVAAALAQNTEHGLAELLPKLQRSAAKLREEVEEERYFEEGAVNYRQRAEFAEISFAYRDGERLRTALWGWTGMIGMFPDYDPTGRIATFIPRKFNLQCLENAKFALPPSMTEALERSGRTHNLVIRGTFDRDRAIVREDIVFFAPGESWTDALLANAFQADRGRCTGILRFAPELSRNWLGIEFFYRLAVDARPLYAAGYHPTHLLRSQGYLERPTLRLIVSQSGERVKPASPVGRILGRDFDDRCDQRIGKRGGSKSVLPIFKKSFPPETWSALVHRMVRAAEQQIRARPGLSFRISRRGGYNFCP